jgi:hypothetical protein
VPCTVVPLRNVSVSACKRRAVRPMHAPARHEKRIAEYLNFRHLKVGYLNFAS